MGSHGTSWADQWDEGPDPVSGSNQSKKKSNNNNVLGKTKAVASTGVKKLKEGTSVSFQWIKTKYNKTTQKHWITCDFSSIPCVHVNIYSFFVLGRLLSSSMSFFF